MPTAVIAEDEAIQKEALCSELTILWPELDVCAMASDGIEALAAFERHRPQIMFLDIEMPVLSGLEVARRLAGQCQIVFITAFNNHAITAFEQGAVDYLLKPYQTPRLRVALDRVRARLGHALPSLESLLRELSNLARPARHLHWIKALKGNNVELVLVDDVCFFQADAKYTGVFTATGETLIRTSIKALSSQLDPDRFWQVSRGTIVQVDAISAVTRGFDGSMQLLLKQRPERLTVSENYRHIFRHI